MSDSNLNSKVAGIFNPAASVGYPPGQTNDQSAQSNQPNVMVADAMKQILSQPAPVPNSPQATSQPTPQPVQPTSAVQAQASAPPSLVPPSDLDVLEAIINQAEQTVPQALPTAMIQTADSGATSGLTGQPASPSRGGKETIGATTPDNSALEAGGSVQYVEYEPNAELSPELEGYINRVEQNIDQAPNEIVIADTSAPMPANHQLPSQPVVVLPITPEIEKIGAKQSPKFSIRWLVEWSRKIIKTFVGKVIYRQT